MHGPLRQLEPFTHHRLLILNIYILGMDYANASAGSSPAFFVSFLCFLIDWKKGCL